MRPKAVFTGFNSAWTRGNRGAIAQIVDFGDRLELTELTTASFEEALLLINANVSGSNLEVIAIDQPLIVPNQTGSRPVEGVFRSMLGSLGGAIQPSSRSRIGMFDDCAPIWSFLRGLDADEDVFAIPRAKSGRFAFEVYPVAAQIGLRSRLAMPNRLLKYNPAGRKTFRPDDWLAMCALVAAEADRLGIDAVADWCEWARMAKPHKCDQDKLDSLICALVAYMWWRDGLAASAAIGDLVNGYIVTPVAGPMVDCLRPVAEARGVPFATGVRSTNETSVLA